MTQRWWWLVGAVWLVSGAQAAFAADRLVPCPGGRYVIRDGQILYGASAPLATDAIQLDTRLAIGSGCAPVPVYARATHRGTRFHARWRSCDHLFGGAILRGRLDPTCQAMTGVFVARRAKLRHPFVATHSVCGDGVYDPGNEACEGEDGCDGGVCTDGCVCLRDGVVTSTTITTTTTTVTQATGANPTTTTIISPTSTTARATTTTRVSTTTTTSPPRSTLDLTPLSSNMPSNVTAGQLLTVRWEVKNNSTDVGSPSWRDALVFSTDDAVGDDTFLASTTWTQGIAAEATYATAQPIRIPDVAAGDYFLLIRVDYLNNKPEADESNNVLVVPVTVVEP